MKYAFILNPIERQIILLIGDLFFIGVSLNLFVNYAIDEDYLSPLLDSSLFALGICIYLFLSYVLDFYNLEKASRFNTIISQSIFVSGLFALMIFFGAILLFDASFWRIPLLTFLVGTPLLIFLWRLLYKNTFRFIPTIRKTLYIYDKSNEKDYSDYVGYINGNELKETYYKVRLSYDIDKNILEGKNKFMESLSSIDTCIINIKDYGNLPEDVKSIIIRLIEEGKDVQSYTSFYENNYEALPIQSHNDSFYEILQMRNKKIRYLQILFTAITDYLLSFLIGCILLAVLPFVCFFNFFFNQGPLFYSQNRVGKNGKEFKIYKFRSMVVDAEKSGAKMATTGDTRITPFGKILRKLRIDELPQILSVIKGDMTFIGPRPERKIFTEQLNKLTPFYSIRHIVKPGITGWAQVKYKYGENLQDSIKKLEYDLYYIKNKSITLDAKIIFKTITAILFSKGV
ncbi:sugar transferase [Sinomicrobium sp. M5D2P17]